MKQAKIICLYTRHYFSYMLKYMVDNNMEIYLDKSDTLWHIDDVKSILMDFLIAQQNQGKAKK